MPFQKLDNVISLEESYILLGDFNACVRSSESVDEQWDGVRGPHGFGVHNIMLEESCFLFLSLHEAIVCNTWFVDEKHNIHKQTWQQPKSKMWSCKDFVVMQQNDRYNVFGYVAAKSVCNTDHHLVCIKLRLQKGRF